MALLAQIRSYWACKLIDTCLVASYDLRPGNGAGLILKEKKISEWKVKKKRRTGETYDVNKQIESEPLKNVAVYFWL